MKTLIVSCKLLKINLLKYNRIKSVLSDMVEVDTSVIIVLLCLVCDYSAVIDICQCFFYTGM